MRKYSSYFMGRHLYKFLSPGGCVDSSHSLAATLSKHMRGSQSAWRHGIIQHCPTQLIGLSPYNFTAQYNFTSQYSFTAHYSSPHTTAHLTVQLHLSLQFTSQYSFTSHYSSPHTTTSLHSTASPLTTVHLSLQLTSQYSSPHTTAHHTVHVQLHKGFHVGLPLTHGDENFSSANTLQSSHLSGGWYSCTAVCGRNASVQ